MQLVRKQLIMIEVFSDLVKVVDIMKNLLKFDSTFKNEQRENGSVGRVEAKNQRAYYRHQFSEFVIKEIKHKYSHQMYLFYQADEKKIGLDFSEGVAAQMKRRASQYGIRARSILLHIAALMIKYNLNFTDSNYKFNPASSSLSKFAQKLFVPSNPLFGWMMAVKNNKEI